MKHIAKAKSSANTERNRSKKIARRAANRRERHRNAAMMSCLVTEALPVLDLMGYGGNATAKVYHVKCFGVDRQRFGVCLADVIASL